MEAIWQFEDTLGSWHSKGLYFHRQLIYRYSAFDIISLHML